MYQRRLIIEGTKIVLMQFQEEDITLEYISWLNDPDVVKYSNQRFKVHTYESCRDHLSVFDNSNSLFFSIRHKDSNSSVGTITAYISERHKTADIGIMVGKRSFWGFGLGQDSFKTLINWLFCNMKLRKITAGTMSNNIAMKIIMERSGMTLEAVRYQQELMDGKPQDLIYYAKFNPHGQSPIPSSGNPPEK